MFRQNPIGEIVSATIFTGSTGATGPTGYRGITTMKCDYIILYKVLSNKEYGIVSYYCRDMKAKTFGTITNGAGVRVADWKNMIKCYEIWMEGWLEFYKFVRKDVESKDIFKTHILKYYVDLRLIHNEYNL